MKQIQRWLVLLTVAACLVVSGMAQAALQLPTLFTDHMVLQRNMECPIWGWGDPGAKVDIRTPAGNVSAVIRADGKFIAKLPELKTGGPYTLYVECGEQKITLSDVLVGEVWVCSGQSNMQWTVEGSNNWEQEKQLANYPTIRMFSVERVASPTMQAECKASWAVCAPDTVASFSAVGYFFARKLQQELKIPVGMLHSSWGGTPAESWMNGDTLKANPDYKPILDRWQAAMDSYPTAIKQWEVDFAAWEAEKKKAEAEGKPLPRPYPPGKPWDDKHSWRPAGLFNAMIVPLVPYGIKGAIWYQGESNAGRAEQYQTLFPDMITDWRNAWGQGEFPFYFVQLANFMERKAEPGPSAWAELREAQLKTLALKNTGMAVIIDIGDAKDIHPKNKQDVGLRLALIALNRDYNKDVTWSGPIFKRAERLHKQYVLYFKHATKGLHTPANKPLKGFEIAGPDKKFVWANAEIRHEKVYVWSDYVADPVVVRYGWADNPECNLYNGDKLPASPFRTDTWPGTTAGIK